VSIHYGQHCSQINFSSDTKKQILFSPHVVQFNCVGNVREFLTKVKLYSAPKGYSGEKSTENLASRLAGQALNVYTHLDTDDFGNINAELLKEFERGQVNREGAIPELKGRHRRSGE